MRPGRFHPPTINISPAVAWVLERALGPENEAGYRLPDPNEAVSLAESMKLATRIRRRTSLSCLQLDLGVQHALRFADQQKLEIASQMQFEATSHYLARAANKLSFPIIFLKGSALRFLGVINPADRPTVDVDVLVSKEHINEYQGVLLDAGFSTPSLLIDKHHLPPFWHPRWRTVEVHQEVPGLRLSGESKSATAEDLIDLGLCTPVNEKNPNALIPRLDVVAGHLIVHALAQHGNEPWHFFRLLSDLQSVRERTEDPKEVMTAAIGWIEWAVNPIEAEALIETVRRFSSGAATRELIAERTPSTEALRHFVAFSFDERYKAACLLRANVKRRRFGDLSQARRLPKRLWWNRHDLTEALSRQITPVEAVCWNLIRPLVVIRRYLPLAGYWMKTRREQLRG